jgi:RHS repeat-associated protein
MQPAKATAMSQAWSASTQRRPNAGEQDGDTGVRISAASIEVPKGGGAISAGGQRIEHNPFDGSAAFTIPIVTPSPRGVSPGLSLTYSSASGNGPFGMGFALAVPKFTRRSASFGIPRYDESDRFSHSEQGTLVAKLTAQGAIEYRLEPEATPAWCVRTYLPRVEGTFERIELWERLSDGSSHWLVRNNANETRLYGGSEEARIRDPAAPERIAEWLLEETVDAHGNTIRYHYRAADAEPDRELTSNRYLSEIAFGNFEHEGQEQFNVRVVLDYGGHVGETPGPEPTITPEPRPDPFSAYVTGFEVRTIWRCRRLLIYTTHPDLFASAPTLIRALTLEYDQGPTGLSMLTRIGQRGFRKNADGSYVHEDMPPLTCGFTPFEPFSQTYSELALDNRGIIPGAIGDSQYLLADLDGEGLPGILYSSSGQTLYWPPLGEGRYGAPVAPERFPSFRNLDGRALTLTSLESNGRLDLVSSQPGRAGYFTLEPAAVTEPVNATTNWTGLRPFETIPSNYGSDAGMLVSLNGDGRLDFLEAQAPVLRCYPSLGTRGFGAADLAQMPADYPAMGEGGAQYDTYADLFGDGLSHRVRVSPGRVECWPDLGYGTFGAKVSLSNAPHYGDALDARRIFFADLDGSGPADLVYATEDALLIHFNHSGNGFSDPLRLPLPAPFDSSCRISFADVYGTGANCLILTRLEPEVKHYVYAFSGTTKPYLLATFDDAMGTQTRCTYTTSVNEYLRDKRAGRNWITRTYFPVQVVAAVETLDAIAKARNVQRFAYHDGYFDPVLKQFQGFGEVESWDSETFENREEATSAGIVDLDPLPPELFAPIAYTRAWFHTGAFVEAQAVARQNRAAFWHGDPQAPALPEYEIAPELEAAGAAVLRQAYAALAGRMIRSEVYGLDASASEMTPYSVSQSTAAVRQIQPKGPNANAVVQPFIREQISANYERNAADPRITHEFMLAQDSFGNVKRSCSIAYPRRPGPDKGPSPYPEQEEIRITADEFSHVVHPGDAGEPARWIGQQVEARTYQLSDVAPADRYFSFDEISEQCDVALAHQIPFGQPFDPGVRTARLFEWTRTYYWNADQAEPLPLGEIAPLGLVHHSESAVMTPALVEQAFSGEIPESTIVAAGYALDQGYWWNRGLIQYYETRDGGFSQPSRTDGLFEGVATDGPLNPTTLTTWDGPALYVTSVSRIGSVAGSEDEPREVMLTSTVTTDYQAGLPDQITDPNGTATQLAYSPLGMVVATAILGSIEGQPAGDLPLSERVPTPAPSIEAIIAEPQAFLQGSTSYFHYDLLAWTTRHQPAAAIEVTRQRHVHQLGPGEESPMPITITYRDGSGRDVEGRVRFGPEFPEGPDRWAVSGRVRLDNKGEPVETYSPFFAGSAYYDDNVPIDGPLPPPDVTNYDAVKRPVLEISSRGFLRRWAYASWMTTLWDENDTVLDSPFYKAFPADPKTPEQKREAAALAQAVHAYNTPTRSCIDPAGGVIRVLSANLGAITPDTLAPAVAGQAITAQELWDRLVADGYLEPAAQFPGAAWATARLQPYLVVFQQDFSERYGDLAAPTLDILKETGLTTFSVLDIQGRTTRLKDPRLFYDTITGASDLANFSFLLDMAGNALRTISADAGPRQSLVDIFGNEIVGIGGGAIETHTTFDRLARPVRVDVVEPDGGGTIVRRAEVFVYGERHPDPASRNLNGELWQSYDDAGLETTDLYDLAGNALAVARRVRRDYTQPANWTADAIAAIGQEDALVTSFTFDAEQARVVERTPDGSVTHFAYDLAGQISRVTVQTDGETVARTIVDSASYTAFGARLHIAYGNGVVTENRYERDTQRLAGVTSANAAGEKLQDVALTYDPVGNITEKVDRSWETVFCYNQHVDPASTYGYDPLYRLIRGTGRQPAGASARAGRGAPEVMPFCPANPADREQLENYVEDFAYDDGGNLVRLRHTAPRGSWTTELPVDTQSNRLDGVSYDVAGNQLALHGTLLRWDYRNRLSAATLLARSTGDDDSEHYLYDSSGERVLRVTRRLKQAEDDAEPALYEISETLFLGDYERTRVFQETGPSNSTPFSISEALSIPDDDGHFCVIERATAQVRSRRTADDNQWQGRFLLANQIASVTQEIDDAGVRLTYREYCAYGATAFVAAKNTANAAASKFRFAGKRRDDATGLYYFGMRYYPPRLARWLSADPAGIVDGTNLYAYVGGNPISFTDPNGLAKGSNNSVSIHGKMVRKPPSHANMHSKSEKLGQMIAQEIVASGVDNTARLKKFEKDIANIQIDAGLPIHDEDKVDQAMKAGMRGDKTTFDRLFRAALPGMDEQISTATMYYIAKGAGKVKMKEVEWKQFAYGFRIASRLRLETEYSGYSTKHGLVQHPTSVGSEFFGSSGKGHTYWDRARREDVVDYGLATTSKGVDRMLGMIAEAGRHSLSYGVAPSRARNISTLSRISKRRLKRQMRNREGIKRIVLTLRGEDISLYPTQSRHKRWRPSRNAPPSPLRIGYY